MSELRNCLKARTAAAHDAVERLYGALDLSQEAGLTRFLLAHFTAVRAIEASLDDDPRTPPGLACFRLLPLLEADLDALGVAARQPAVPLDPVNRHPLGLLYVLGGSRLGAKILSRRVAPSLADRLPEHGGYLSSARPEGMWLAFLQHLRATEFADAERNAIVRSALAGFKCFADAAPSQAKLPDHVL